MSVSIICWGGPQPFTLEGSFQTQSALVSSSSTLSAVASGYDSHDQVFQLIWILVKHRLDRLIPTNARPFLANRLIFPLRLLPAPSLNAGKDLASALVELGPAFIKVGQLLSTRDLFPDEVIEGLSTLQDQVRLLSMRSP